MAVTQTETRSHTLPHCQPWWDGFDFFDILIKGSYIHRIHRKLADSVITRVRVVQVSLYIHVGSILLFTQKNQTSQRVHAAI